MNTDHLTRLSAALQACGVNIGSRPMQNFLAAVASEGMPPRLRSELRSLVNDANPPGRATERGAQIARAKVFELADAMMPERVTLPPPQPVAPEPAAEPAVPFDGPTDLASQLSGTLRSLNVGRFVIPDLMQRLRAKGMTAGLYADVRAQLDKLPRLEFSTTQADSLQKAIRLADELRAMHGADKDAVKLLATILCKAAGERVGDLVIVAQEPKGARNFTVPNGPNAAKNICKLVAEIGRRVYADIFFSGCLFKPGTVAEFRGLKRRNVEAVFCLGADGAHDPRHTSLPFIDGACEVEIGPGHYEYSWWLDKPAKLADIEPLLAALHGHRDNEDQPLPYGVAKRPDESVPLYRLPGCIVWGGATTFQARWAIPPDDTRATIAALKAALA